MRSRAGFVGSAASMLNYFSVAATVAMGSIFVNGVASRLRAVLSMLLVTHVGSDRSSVTGTHHPSAHPQRHAVDMGWVYHVQSVLAERYRL